MSRGSYLQHKNDNSLLSIERLLDLVAPHDCLFCGQEGSLVCAWCLPELFAPLPSRCYRCLALTADYATCRKCRRESLLKHAWVAADYTDASKLLVHAFKFERKKAAHRHIAQVMAAALPYLPPEIIISHIPTATSRVRRRGYDQAQLLARWLAREKQRTYTPLLARMGQIRQVGAKRAERIRQIQQAFRVRNGAVTKIRDAHVLLVDDVTTTGATLESAARVLHASGARQVSAVVFAQKH